jgi:hypothetical protein
MTADVRYLMFDMCIDFVGDMLDFLDISRPQSTLSTRS